MTSHTQSTTSPFILSALEGGQQWLIDRELIAGRDSGCDLVLDKGQASRQHAKFSPAADGILVEDLQSTNGTFVNDQRISAPTLLRVGDVVSIGPAGFTVKQNVTAPPVDPDATMLFTPVAPISVAVATQPEPAAPQSSQAKAAPADHAVDSKAPPSWVLSNQQSVDGTKFISKDVLQSVMAQSQQSAALPDQVTEPTLIGTGDPIVGMRFQLLGSDKNQWEIGRSPKSDVMINHDSVSSAHGQIVRDGKRWKLMDLMSANGTFVNGKKCLTGYLSHGDSLRFGSVECRFVLPGESSGKKTSGSASRNTTKVAAIAFVATMVVVAAVWFAVSQW